MNKAAIRRQATYTYTGLCGAVALVMALQRVVSLTAFSKNLLLAAGSALLVYSVSAFVVRRYQDSLTRLPSTTVWDLADKACQYAGRNHFLLVTCALLPSMLFYVYGSSLSYSFMGDDFGCLWLFHVLKLKIFSPLMYRGTFHYFPVGYMLCGIPSLLVGFRPFLFHAQCLLIHLLNALLVYWLCYRSTRNKLVSLAACALFFTYFFNYETVFWVAGIFTSAMTLFSLAAFLCFARYLEEPGALVYVGFILFFALAILTMEAASVMLLLCPIYEFLSRPLRGAGTATMLDKAAESVRRLKKYFLPALILAFHGGVKAFYGIALTNMDIARQQEAHLLKQVFFSMFYMMIPNRVMGIGALEATSVDVFLFTVLFSALVLYIFIKGSVPLRFFFLWGVMIMSLTEVMTAIMGARYFYLPVAGFSIFLAILLHDLCRWAGRFLGNDAFDNNAPSSHLQLRPVVRLAENAAFVLLACGIVLKGAAFVRAKDVEWHKASGIVTNVLSDIKFLFPEPPVDQEVYFVNIPERLSTRADTHVFFYRSAFIAALHLTYGESWEVTSDWMRSWFHDHLDETHGERFARKIHFIHTKDHVYPVVGRETPAVSRKKLRELSLRPDVVVVLFDPAIDSLVRL